MRVKALKQGYFNHRRIKAGEIFDMPEEAYQPVGKDGKPLMYKEGSPKFGKPMTCSWVEPVDGKAVKGKKAKVQEDDSLMSDDVI